MGNCLAILVGCGALDGTETFLLTWQNLHGYWLMPENVNWGPFSKPAVILSDYQQVRSVLAMQ